MDRDEIDPDKAIGKTIMRPEEVASIFRDLKSKIDPTQENLVTLFLENPLRIRVDEYDDNIRVSEKSAAFKRLSVIAHPDKGILADSSGLNAMEAYCSFEEVQREQVKALFKNPPKKGVDTPHAHQDHHKHTDGKHRHRAAQHSFFSAFNHFIHQVPKAFHKIERSFHTHAYNQRRDHEQHQRQGKLNFIDQLKQHLEQNTDPSVSEIQKAQLLYNAMTALAMEFQKNPPAWNSWQGTKGRLEQALFNKIRALEAAHGGPGQNRGQGRVALMISEPGRLGALASKGVSDRTILDNLLVLYKVNPAPAPEQPRQGAPKRP